MNAAFEQLPLRVEIYHDAVLKVVRQESIVSSPQKFSEATFWSEFARHLIGDDGIRELLDWRTLTVFSVLQPVLAVASDICTVAGTPLAAFSKWMFVGCFSLAIVSAVLALTKPHFRKGPYAKAAVVLFASALVAGIVCGAQNALASGDSIIASSIPDIRNLQNIAVTSFAEIRSDLKQIVQSTNSLSKQMKDIKDTEDQKQMQNRAWLSIGQDIQVKRLTKGTTVNDFELSTVVKNVGMTPAGDVRFEAHEYLLPTSGGTIQLNHADGYCEGEIRKNSHVMIGNGDAIAMPFQKVEFVPGNEPNNFIPTSVDRFGQASIDKFTRNSAALVLDLTICYSDVFGRSHFFRSCRSFQSEKDFNMLAAASCTAGNDFD